MGFYSLQFPRRWGSQEWGTGRGLGVVTTVAMVYVLSYGSFFFTGFPWGLSYGFLLYGFFLRVSFLFGALLFLQVSFPL